MYAILLTALLTQAPTQGDRENKFTKDASFDGNWTVLSYEKDGKPMTDAKDAKVTIKDNTATFTAAAGANKGEMKAMRFTFGPNATIQVAEANADGKFDTSAPEPAGAGRPAAAGMKSGVYVLTNDYLAVCIHSDSARAGAGGTGDVRPAGGAAGTDKPNAKTYCTVILKREGTRP